MPRFIASLSPTLHAKFDAEVDRLLRNRTDLSWVAADLTAFLSREGFTIEEKDGMSSLLADALVDQGGELGNELRVELEDHFQMLRDKRGG